MSFWSSLVLARVAPPPTVTAADIGRFVHRVVPIGALTDDSQALCRIKYGDRIDSDEETTDVVIWDESGIIGQVGDYPWDRNEEFRSASEMADALLQDERTVYRAYVDFGCLGSDVVETLTREPCEQNEIGLCLWALSLNIGPVWVAGLASEQPAFVGWMDLTLSGPGYFYPWTFRQGRDRAESNPRICQLVESCRTSWPVEQVRPASEKTAARKQMAELWLYDEFDLPNDWLWFASETG